MNYLKKIFSLVKTNLSLFFNLFLKKDLSLKKLSYIAFFSFFICYIAISPITKSINIDILRYIISIIIIIFFLRHIYLIYQYLPKKDKKNKHKRTKLDIILLRNQRPLDSSDLIKIIIALDLFVIAVFFGYFA